jgi:alkanesulfonate monooxygenase SsuD/methylene tetrahydromethanopterin reductase-like flavin-dependent oxidoreductase (luciferase family)
VELGLFFEFYLRPDASHAEAFEEAFSQIEFADRLGLDSIWLAEHHFSPGRSVLSSPLMIANAVANRTRHVRVGTAVEVLPLGNPIRLAEEVATLDHLSNGRFEFGIGRSGSPTGYVGYNIPYTESRARFYETLEVIRRAWTQDRFSFKGDFFNYENVCVVPKPLQNPHPPIRNAATSAVTFSISAKMGLPIFIGVRGRSDLVQERVEIYRSEWNEAEHSTKPDVALRIPVYVADTMEKAQSEPKESTLNFFKNTVATLNFPVPGLSDEENRERVDRGERMKRISYEEILETDTVYGTPEFVTDRLLQLQEEFGLSSVIAEVTFGGIIPRDNIENSIKLLAEKVAPKLR